MTRRAARVPRAAAAVAVVLVAGAALTLALRSGVARRAPTSIAVRAGSDTPGGVVLAFWDALASGEYAAAYARLDPAARASITLSRFTAAARRGRSALDRRPEVTRILSVRPGVARVSVAGVRDGVQRPDLPVVVFRVRRIRRAWRIASGVGT
jgi:hypothetical protein